MTAPALSSALHLRPRCRLGAASPGGLALPDAHPSATTLYAPRGVFLDLDPAAAEPSGRIVVVDSGNHRVLLWNRLPGAGADGEPADGVLGQRDFTTEGARAAGRGPEAGFHLPTAALIVDGTLLVADAWHHRIAGWTTVPTASGTPPDFVLGQPDPRAIEPNRGGPVDAHTLYWPYGLAWIDGLLWVADTGNRRVLGWHGLPEAGQPAEPLRNVRIGDRRLKRSDDVFAQRAHTSKAQKLISIPKICATKTAAIISQRAVPSMLTVAPRGIVNAATDESEPASVASR